MRVAVIGGGITGLAASHYLLKSGRAEVCLYEPDHVGGKLASINLAGREIDLGPDSFLRRFPEMMGLIEDLGLQDRLTYPLASEVKLLINGRLFDLPSETVMGVPAGFSVAKRAGLLSAPGYMRLRRDRFSRRHKGADISVKDLVEARLGNEAYEKMVAPLVGSVYAGDPDELSAAMCAPELLAFATTYGSLVKGAKKAARKRGLPPFATVLPTTATLASQLFSALTCRSSFEYVSQAVSGLGRDGKLIVVESDRGPLRFEKVVLATDAKGASSLLRKEAPEAAEAIGGIKHASVAVLSVAFACERLPLEPLRGILVAKGGELLTTAVTFLSSKWPHLNLPDLRFLRISCGSSYDLRPFELDDKELTERLLSELSGLLGDLPSIKELHLKRWPDSFPQYRPGHGSLASQIRQSARSAFSGGLFLAGAFLGGIGAGSRVREAAGIASGVLST